MGEGSIASGRRISSRVRICEPVTMMIMIHDHDHDHYNED